MIVDPDEQGPGAPYPRTKEAQTLKDNITYWEHWAYSIFKIIGAVASIAAVVISILLIILTCFLISQDDAALLVTNTFFVSPSNYDRYAWPVLPNAWSGLPASPAPFGSAAQLNVYYECMFQVEIGTAKCSNSTVDLYSTCLQSQYSSQLSACSSQSYLFKSTSPTLNQYSQCLTSQFSLTPKQTSALGLCLQSELWPLYAVPQDITSGLFVGSYNWLLLVVIGFTLFSVFAAYTWWPKDFHESYEIEFRRVLTAKGRMGFYWAWIPLFLSALTVIVVTLVAFRLGTNWPSDRAYPTTVSTNTLTVTFCLAVLFYFVYELIAFYKYTTDYSLPVPKSRRVAPSEAVHMRANMYPSLQFNTRKDWPSINAYAPLLMVTWSSAYVTDAIFFLGLVGATMQVDADDAYNIFWGIFLYRLANVALAELLHEAYIPKKSFDNQDTHQTRVLAMATHFGIIFYLSSVCITLLNPNKLYSEYTLLVSAVATLLIIPEALRFLTHLGVLGYKVYRTEAKTGLVLVLLYQFIWTWDLIIRIVLISFVAWGPSSTPGTKPYLVDANGNLTLALKYLAI